VFVTALRPPEARPGQGASTQQGFIAYMVMIFVAARTNKRHHHHHHQE
jgi:hypothetical protein